MSRFSASKWAIVSILALTLAFAGIVILAGRLVAGPPVRFDDLLSLAFLVLDGETSSPIPGAALSLIDPFGNPSDDGDTDATLSDDRGRAVLSRDLDLGELVNKVKDGHQFRVLGWRVKVSARGYETSTTPLFEHTGEVIDDRAPTVKQPLIRLRRTKNPSHEDAVEWSTFVYRDWGSTVSLVFYGTKFDALLSCPKLCSHHTPWFESKYGTVTRVDGVLRFSIQRRELIPTKYEREDKWFVNNLVPVKWGKRQYLVPQEQGIAFCNAVNLGGEPRGSDYGGFPLGEGQEKLTVTGLPKVPEAWSQYLLKASVLGEVTELLPDFKAKVNVGRNQGLRPGMELVPIKLYLFSDMEIVSVEEKESIIKTKYPNGKYKKIQVGDIVSSHRPRANIMIKKGP
jgi:hypothetical protein